MTFRGGLRLVMLALCLACAWPMAAAKAQEPRPQCAAASVPALTGPLMDGAKVAGHRAQAVERALSKLYADTGVQFVVLTLPTLGGAPLAPYAHQVMETWRLGAPGSDLGLLLLVVTQDRQNRLEVGYGLEGALPDVVAKRLLADVLAPKATAGGQGVLDSSHLEAMITAVDALVRTEAERGTLPHKTPPQRNAIQPMAVPGWLLLGGLLFAAILAYGLMRAAPRYGDGRHSAYRSSSPLTSVSPGLWHAIVRAILIILSGGGGPRSGSGGSGYSGGGGRSGGGGASDRY